MSRRLLLELETRPHTFESRRLLLELETRPHTFGSRPLLLELKTRPHTFRSRPLLLELESRHHTFRSRPLLLELKTRPHTFRSRSPLQELETRPHTFKSRRLLQEVEIRPHTFRSRRLLQELETRPHTFKSRRLLQEVEIRPHTFRMLSSHSATSVPTSTSPPPPRTVTSDPRQVNMETYWREVQSIEEEQEGEEEEEERKSMDEVELEEAWLTEAGLSSLVVGSSSTESPPVAEAVLSTLTRQQAAMVKKRLDNYNETLRKRNRQPIRDVRDIFTEPDGDSAGHCPFPTQSHPESPPRRYHTTTKTIRRNTNRDGGVFGVSLNSLLDNDRKKFPGVKVPVFFQKLLSFLEQNGLQTEGILRVPGSAAKLKFLRRELDRCWSIFDWTEVRPVDAAGLLKLFIRELPTPLLTHTHLSTFCSVLGVSSEVHQVQALQLLLLLLPETHRNTLRALLVFLRKVVSHQDQNRMSLWNVSMVMAPNLFTHRNRGKKLSITKQRDEMEEAVGGAHLIGLMIRHQDLLWTVPNFLLAQVRQVNQASNQRKFNLSRTTSRLLRRKNEKNDRNQVSELCEGVIRVHAPLHTKVSMAIQLDELTTAKDVTTRFESEISPAQYLYEVGGNIYERRLQPDCCLLDVYRVNPHCDWLIKP
ncbi:rho GTPase-activating protein 28 isoform X3 [Girardinichthys multiradiatus]|uniref:rho GTPase-activating protein 28 isoform X3 n=1 Tax=Girardinichthys multiradiatus TaxID=208333 RepID=UPI001FAD9EDA|nr:rho GTPase-activating protein 28 isoform X3 [Girardinichthys multiradiatus]